MPLHDLQKDFVKYMHDKDVVLPDTFAGPDDDPNVLAFTALFDRKNISVHNRFEVYRNNLYNSLIDVLFSVYPLVGALVGEDFMRHMSREYVRRHLPNTGNLNEYGGDFPAFIGHFETARSLPYLPDVARYEWLKNKSYYAKDDQPLDPSLLQDLDDDEQEKLVLVPRHSLFLLRSDWPVLKISDFCKSQISEAESAKDRRLDISGGGDRMMIYRPGLEVRVLPLSMPEWMFLDCLLTGHTLSGAAEAVLKDFQDFDLTAILSRHFEAGSFSGFKVFSNKG